MSKPALIDPLPQVRSEGAKDFTDFVAIYENWVRLTGSIIKSVRRTNLQKYITYTFGEDTSLLT